MNPLRLFPAPLRALGLSCRVPAFLIALVLAGCATPPTEPQPTLMDKYKPRSVLVLPPKDNTLEVDASYKYLPTVTRYLAERGFYVFPVAVVDRLMRENGLPGPHEMHQVSRSKLSEVFGADTVLYLTLHDWGTSYKVIDSITTVRIEARLVDLASGTELWSDTRTASQRSSDGANGVVGLLVNALVSQVASSIKDNSPLVAEQANAMLFGAHNQPVSSMSRRSLPPGPYRLQLEDKKPSTQNASAKPGAGSGVVSGSVNNADKPRRQ